MCKCGECGKYLSHSHWTILIKPLPSSKSEIIWFHPNSSWLYDILGKGQTMLSTEGVLDKAVHCGIWFYCNHPTWVGACLLTPSYGFNCTSNTIIKVTAGHFKRYEIRRLWQHTENVKCYDDLVLGSEDMTVWRCVIIAAQCRIQFQSLDRYSAIQRANIFL